MLVCTTLGSRSREATVDGLYLEPYLGFPPVRRQFKLKISTLLSISFGLSSGFSYSTAYYSLRGLDFYNILSFKAWLFTIIFSTLMGSFLLFNKLFSDCDRLCLVYLKLKSSRLSSKADPFIDLTLSNSSLVSLRVLMVFFSSLVLMDLTFCCITLPSQVYFIPTPTCILSASDLTSLNSTSSFFLMILPAEFFLGKTEENSSIIEGFGSLMAYLLRICLLFIFPLITLEIRLLLGSVRTFKGVPLQSQLIFSYLSLLLALSFSFSNFSSISFIFLSSCSFLTRSSCIFLSSLMKPSSSTAVSKSSFIYTSFLLSLKFYCLRNEDYFGLMSLILLNPFLQRFSLSISAEIGRRESTSKGEGYLPACDKPKEFLKSKNCSLLISLMLLIVLISLQRFRLSLKVALRTTRLTARSIMIEMMSEETSQAQALELSGRG